MFHVVTFVFAVILDFSWDLRLVSLFSSCWLLFLSLFFFPVNNRFFIINTIYCSCYTVANAKAMLHK